MTKAPRKEHPYAPDTTPTDDAKAEVDRVVVLHDDPEPAAAVGVTKVFSTRLAPDLVRRVKVYAAEQGKSVQEVVTEALSAHIP